MKLESAEIRRALELHPHFPFCSSRCKMADLGHWFAEDYRIPRPVTEDDLPDALDETL